MPRSRLRSSASVSQPRSSTHRRRNRAMWAGGPPKPVIPIRPQSASTVRSGTGGSINRSPPGPQPPERPDDARRRSDDTRSHSRALPRRASRRTRARTCSSRAPATEPCAATVNGDPRDMPEQSLANPVAATLRHDEQILEPDPGTALPGRERAVEDRVADCRRRRPRRAPPRRWGRGRTAPCCSSAGEPVTASGCPLVVGQRADQREQLVNVRRSVARADASAAAQDEAGRSISRLRILPVGPFGRSSTSQT